MYTILGLVSQKSRGPEQDLGACPWESLTLASLKSVFRDPPSFGREYFNNLNLSISDFKSQFPKYLNTRISLKDDMPFLNLKIYVNNF